MSEELEVWKPVAGYEGLYEASSLGAVRRVGKESPLVGTMAGERRNYRAVHLCAPPRKQATFRVHAIIATAFHGPRPAGAVCRHLNGDTMDNRASNLAWGTAQENAQDSIVHGTFRINRADWTECKRGHPLKGSNLIVKAKGHRACRSCNLTSARTHYHGLPFDEAEADARAAAYIEADARAQQVREGN